MFLERAHPSAVNGRPSMFILNLGSISSFKYANFDTAAKSVESTFATNLLQNGSQAVNVPLTW